MDKIRTTEGELSARDMRITIVAARFNDFIVESLIKGALHCLRAHGAVSRETAEAMALGAARVSGAELAVAVTGIAGPGGLGGDQGVL